MIRLIRAALTAAYLLANFAIVACDAGCASRLGRPVSPADHEHDISGKCCDPAATADRGRPAKHNSQNHCVASGSPSLAAIVSSAPATFLTQNARPRDSSTLIPAIRGVAASRFSSVAGPPVSPGPGASLVSLRI